MAQGAFVGLNKAATGLQMAIASFEFDLIDSCLWADTGQCSFDLKISAR